MNTEALHVALQNSFRTEAHLRDPAEETIKGLKHVPGAPSMLLQIASEKQVQYEVRQAAAIHLKNLCNECWTEQRSRLLSLINGESAEVVVLIRDEDKASVRLNLVEALLTEAEKSIRDLMAETLRSIAIHDYPQNWPNLLPNLLETISMSDDASQALRVHNALLALRKVCKRYEYKSREEREPLNEIVTKSFHLLLPLAQRLSSPNEHSLEAALMLKQILKIFWSSTQFFLPGGTSNASTTASPQSMQPWFDVIQAVLVKPLPEASTGLEPRNQPTAVDERNAWPWWKVKKWGAQIIFRFFSRYGITAYAEEELKEFSMYFSQNTAPQFLGPVCEILNLRPSGQFCTDKLVYSCINFVDLAVDLASTYKMLKPHLDFLLYKVCFPTMCLNTEDIELFENDPHEFVLRQNNPLTDFTDPRMAAINLMEKLVKNRGQDVTLPLLAFLTEKIQRYGASDDASKNHIEKDGSLMAFGSLSEILLSSEKFSAEIEGLLVTSVMPDFNSNVAFLRSRACWMVQKFAKVKWTDDGTHLKTTIELVLQRLADPALPVRIEASQALRYLIETEGAEQTLLPVLPQLLEQYFRIMDEIGHEDVVNALKAIIENFGDHIGPHAVALVQQLCTAFTGYCDCGDDDDEAVMAAIQCLSCIATVLGGIYERPDLYKSIEPIIIPILKQVFASDGMIEYLDNGLEILTFLTFFVTDISPGLWELFPMIHNAFDSWAFDCLKQFVTPLDNYIGKSPQQFLQGSTVLPEKGTVPFIDLIFDIIEKTVSQEHSTESEARKAISLYMSILHHCRGAVDKYVPIMNDTILSMLTEQVNQELPMTRYAIYQVLGSLFHYNPLLQLQELEKRGVTQLVFTEWLKDLEKMDRWMPQQMSVIGISSILQLPSSSLPQTVSSSVPQLITALAALSSKMIEEAKHRSDDDDVQCDEGDAGRETKADPLAGFGEDEDVCSESDEAYLEALTNAGGGTDLGTFLMGGGFMDDDDDDDEDYTSPVVEMDQLIFFSDSLKAAFDREPQFYQQVQGALAPEVVNKCQELFAAADVERQKK